jgi:hypothetical protein
MREDCLGALTAALPQAAVAGLNEARPRPPFRGLTRKRGEDASIRHSNAEKGQDPDVRRLGSTDPVS